MEKLLSDLKAHSHAWPFQQPVNEKEVPDYYDVITSPMGASFSLTPLFSPSPAVPAGATRARAAPLSSVTDFSTMEHKLDTNQYTDTDVFLDDAQLVFDNCRAYNPEDTVYHKCATRLEKYMRDQMKALGLVRSSKVKRERDE